MNDGARFFIGAQPFSTRRTPSPANVRRKLRRYGRRAEKHYWGPENRYVYSRKLTA